MENKVYNAYELMEIIKEDEYEDFEEWEADAYFIDKGDWMGLVEFRHQKAEKHPDNLYYQWGLGEAYVLNKEYEKAISFLGDLHKKHPAEPNIQHSLLAALLAIGKDEKGFDWIMKPAVMRLDKTTLDYCYDYLRTKRKPREVVDLYLTCYSEGYPMFSEEQLMLLLHSDDRFTFTGDGDKYYDCFVAVNRKN